MTKLIDTINGFTIIQRLIGSPNMYYQAKRDNTVFTSKSLSYIKNKVALYGKERIENAISLRESN